MSQQRDQIGPIGAVRKVDETVLASITGVIDVTNSPAVRGGLIALVNSHRPKKLVLNLAGVSYMDSSALAVLVEMVRKVGKSGRVVLTDLQPRVRGLLEIARLDTIFQIAASEQEALAK